MRYRLRTWPLVLLAGAALYVPARGAWAQQRAAHLVIAGRQQVRAEVAAVLSDGKLTEDEKDSVLVEAKELLAAEEYAGLERALDRFSQRAAARALAEPVDAGQEDSADNDPADNDQQASSPTTLTGYDATRMNRLVDGAAYQEPTPADPGQSPFKEEDDDEQEGDAPNELVIEEGFVTDSDEGYTILGDETAIAIDGEVVLSRLHSVGTRSWLSTQWFTSVTAFKGPLDLDNENGNFGFTFGVNGAVPVAPAMGIGLQAGTSGVLTDLHGTQFTADRIRSQNFTTVGLFQRLPFGARRLSWGFTFDWMFDHYYDTLKMSQWRVKMAYDLNCRNQIGMWACIPNDGDDAVLGDPGTGPTWNEFFKPIAQGNFYHSHLWESGALTTTWLGLGEEPGEMIFGADAQVPISCRLSLVGGFSYILPSAAGVGGQDEEMWNVTLGVAFTPGGSHRGRIGKFGPLFPLADNGTFAIRRY